LELWQRGNKFGWVFDNETDELNFNDEDINAYGIDGTDEKEDNFVQELVLRSMFVPLCYFVKQRETTHTGT